MYSGELSVAVIVPTLNAGAGWKTWIEAIKSQTIKPKRIMVVDSGSSDETAVLAKDVGFEVITIKREEFNHGGVRQKAANLMPEIDVLVYLTQDAILFDSFSLENLVDSFEDQSVGVVYGRQLPHKCGKPIGSHARLFNYPGKSVIRSMDDAPHFGIKTPFVSNSFAAYRRVVLLTVGGFPSNTILSEDTFVASKMLLAGWKIAYCAEAKVFHSHDYTVIQEFRRYFDTGVFHAREPWIRDAFGSAEGEGKKFVLSEFKFLMNEAPLLIPSAILRTIVKYAGYKLGLHENKIPIAFKQGLSMHSGFWKEST